MSKKKLSIFIVINSLICLIIGAFIPLTLNNFYQSKKVDPTMEKFMEIYDYIKDEWYFLDDGDEEEYIERAINAMVNEQNDDKYLKYYPKKESDADRFGIGVTVSSYDGYLIIKDVFENSPAKKEGLNKDMIITNVDNVDIRNKSLDEVSNLISGPLNTDVTLTLLDKSGNVFNKTITRSTFKQQSVYTTIDKGVATIRITGFEELTFNQFDSYLSDIKQENINDIIIDLRDNGGGLIHQFEQMADLFIPRNASLGEYIHKNSKDNEISLAHHGVKYEFDNIYILINQNSASASESFTCAMKDNLANVKVIGSTSYGKGIAQKTYEFTDGSSLKYTYAEYRRPNKEVNGGVVHELGITPDVLLMDEGNYKIIEKSFNDVMEYNEAYLNYFNSLESLSEDDQLIINKGKEQINNNTKLSNDVKNVVSRLVYDERKSAYEIQLNKVIDLILED